MKRQWADTAHEALSNGQSVTIQPRRQSMTDLIADNSYVTLEPCGDNLPAIGDIVLARVYGRRFSHLVLHLVLAQAPGRYLIGNSSGRRDEWVTTHEIFGRAIRIGD